MEPVGLPAARAGGRKVVGDGDEHDSAGATVLGAVEGDVVADRSVRSVEGKRLRAAVVREDAGH